MSAKTPRYIVENNGHDPVLFATALSGAVQLSTQYRAAQITLLCELKDSLKAP
jgi:hypothetical protein